MGELIRQPSTAALRLRDGSRSATLLLQAPAGVLFGAQSGLVLAIVAALIAAWIGGLWPGLGAPGSVALCVPFGLLVALLGPSRHDLRARLRAEPAPW